MRLPATQGNLRPVVCPGHARHALLHRLPQAERPLCNFCRPAVFRTGPLAIAISTAGASPALAKRIKAEIADEYGAPYARLAELLNEVRGWAKGTLPTYQDRKVFFESIVNGDPDPVELLRAGDEQAVRELIAAAMRAHEPAPAA